MALNDNPPVTQQQLKDMSLQELKAKRRDLLPQIKKLRRNPHVLVEKQKELKKLNCALKTEIASRHIATEREADRLAKLETERKAALEARPAADILPFSIPAPDTSGSLLEVFDIQPIAPLRIAGHIVRA